MNVQDITVDLSKKNVKPESVVLRQGDKSGTTLRVKVLDGGVDVSSLSGYTAKFIMKLPNNRFYYEVAGTISGGTVEFFIDESQAAVEAGVTNIAYVALVNGETTKMSANNVRVEILPSALDGFTPPPEWTDPIDEFFRESEAILRASINEYGADVEALMEQARQDVADAVEGVDEAIDRAIAAAEAAEGIILQDVPTMTKTIKGGAKLGIGLDVLDGSLNVDLSDSGSGASVLTNGCALLDVEGDGWAEQDSTTGKNLLPSGTTSQTNSGITFTVNEDGTVTANGTATTNNAQLKYEFTADFGGNCTFSGCPSGGSGTSNQGYDVYMWDMSTNARPKKWDGTTPVDSDFGSGSEVLIESGKTYNFILRIQLNRTVNNLVFKPQIEVGGSKTSYEPYTGGKPSPSPEYPQEIRVAKGRNLFTSGFENGIYNSTTGLPVSSSDYARSQKTTVRPSTEYTVYFKKLYVASGVYLYEWDASGTFLGQISLGSGSATAYVKTFTTRAATAFVAVACGASSYKEQANTIKQPQLELGSTATPYVPYGHVGLEVQGKNLMPNAAQSQTTNGITFTLDDDGTVTVNGIATAAAFFNMPSTTGFVLPAGTYTISGTPANSGYNAYMRIRDVDHSTYLPADDIGNGATFTINQDTRIYVFIRIDTGYVANNVVFKPQIELGSTATPYVPYFDSTIPVPIPEEGLASVRDGTKDLLSIDSAGHVVTGKRVQRLYFDGSSSSNWSVGGNYASTGGGYWIYSNNQGKDEALSNVAYCDKLKYYNTAAANDLSGLTVYGNKASSIRVHPFTPEGQMTVEQLMTWLQSNPLTFYVKYATPTTIDLGYIDLPLMPDGCTVSIPELRSIGVEWLVTGADGVPEVALDERKRTLYEIALAGDAELANVAPIENGKASTNYSVGSYLVHGGVLYKVTTAIATGETINPGINCVQTTVMAELISLTA